MDRDDLDKLILTVLTALACPLALPTVIEHDVTP